MLKKKSSPPSPAATLAMSAGSSFTSCQVGSSYLVLGNSLDWLAAVPEKSIHAVVTDPPYGLEEYEPNQVRLLRNGRGGIWRLPPSFDGASRAPLPRFTALSPKQRKALFAFFTSWSELVARAVRPGGHVLVAGNAFLSQGVWAAIVAGGLEFRGEIIRLVRTFRGGDRPKGAHKEFADVCSLPRSCYEPWGIFRAPLPPKMTVADCLRQFETGGLRRLGNGSPLVDVIVSGRTPAVERRIVAHPSLKPQSLMRRLVYSALPLGVGTVVDTFAGGGATIAAAEAIGASAIGIERDAEYYSQAVQGVPLLAGMAVTGEEQTSDVLDLFS